MPTIHILDESTINQIAAGEVVERPSAIVKELIENAMDAGATAITAEIKEGGLSFIRITDNGSGIAKEDIPLAFLRHATSKIKTAEDLLSVTSLGFRGEALSSIAAVAQVELITKTSNALNGYRYVIEGGEEKAMEEIGCPAGTTIIVRNIFFNTPARRKFLKSPVTEAGYISDLMERLIVSHPNVAFKFIVNNQIKLQSSGNNNCKDILYHIYGRDISKELLAVNQQTATVTITGFIGKPVITRGNRNFENYFINGRYIKSNVITKAIEEAYKPFLMQHKYPFTSLYYEIDPAMIDVNVHPQKMEIRLKNSDEIYQLTYHLIRDTLAGKEMIPKVLLTEEEEKKKEGERMPEPFEHNRRKEFDERHSSTAPSSGTSRNMGASVFQYGRKQENNIPRVADKNLDYLKATEPLIRSTNPYTENITGLKINASKAFEAKQAENKTDHIKDGHGVSEAPITEFTMTDTQIGKSQLNDGLIETKTSIQQPKEASTAVSHRNDSFKNELQVEETIITEAKSTESMINAPDTNIAIDKATQMSLFETQSSEQTPFLSKKAFEEHRIIGQVFATYWLVEYKKELYIIDQHAAHEKVLYEKIMAAAKSKTFVSQQLLPPIVLTLTLREQEILRKHEEVLTSLGYEIEHFGGNEYSIRAVPADIYSISEKGLLLEFIDSLAEDVPSSAASANSILERVASLSCKAAVKANHALSFEEASALIKELLTLENPYHCPHGRPVIISMSQYELERKFKRIV